MRRRLATCLAAALLALTVLAPAAPAFAGDATEVVLAAEVGGEAPGLEPRPADDPDNEFAPPAYEANFTATLFGRALFGGILLAAVAIALGYWVRVGRFSREQRPS
jgi:hypothetical protein